jgi:hypothetical protein
MDNDLADNNEFPRKYLQFPLFLIREMFVQKEATINKIINYGIYRMGMNQKYDLSNVARQIVYEHYRGNLSTEIKRRLNNYDLEYFGQDEDYNGFSGTTFEPIDELNEISVLLDKDPQLKTLCIEFHCTRQSMQILNITGNIENIIKCAKQTEKRINAKEVFPMIGKHTLFHYRDNHKTETELAQLLAYIAIRSIIGEKGFTKTNKPHIICRMFGYKSIKDIESITVSDIFKKYSNRYHIDKTLKALELDWHVCVYSNKTRGLFISLSNKIPLKKLVEIAEQKKRSKREKDFYDQKCSIINTALIAANKLQPNNNGTAS